MSITGRAVALSLLVVPLVLISPTRATIALFALAWLALLLLDAALAVRPRELTLTREPVKAVRLGESTTSELLVANASSRRLRGVLRDAWQPSAGGSEPARLDVPPGERRRVRFTLTPTRRGERSTRGVVIRSVGPLGLAARQRQLPLPASLRVLPAFTSRRHLPSKLARLRELDGRASVQIRGQGTEFDSLRDYVIGDDVRAIDWRATARRQQVVVRTWRPERDRRVLIVLDTSRTSAARIGDEPRLDASIEAALLLAALASRAGDRVDLLAVDRRVRARVVGAGRGDLLPRLIDAIAPLDADLVETDWPTVVSTIRNQAAHRSLVVLLTSLDAAAIEAGLLPVLPQLTSRHVVVVAGVDDPALARMANERSDSNAVYGAGAAVRAELDRGATIAELRRAGAEIVSGNPAELPPRLADRYLELKAAGRL